MSHIGFPTLWRKWIKECVGTASASVLVNDSPTKEFPVKRGLRQGDPLSPFLFLLAAEGLSIVMKAVVDSHLFTGYRFGSNGAVAISHLQFVDDTLLVGDKSWENVRALRDVLLLFESVSGLKVNFHKSMLTGRGGHRFRFGSKPPNRTNPQVMNNNLIEPYFQIGLFEFVHSGRNGSGIRVDKDDKKIE